MELLIVGAGGMGREIYSWLSQEIKLKKNLSIKGFLDDNKSALSNFVYPVKIVGGILDYIPRKNESLVIAIMEPTVKKKIVSLLKEKGANFYSLIHPNAILGTNVVIGQGTVIAPNFIATNDITIGDFVFCNICVTIGHDVMIGDYTSINTNVDICGMVDIGKECFFGVGAKVIPKRHIGNNAKIGAGSVVIQNVLPNVTVFGNPAKRLM